MTKDEARTKAVETLLYLGLSKDEDEREQFLFLVLWNAYQAGQIEANARNIDLNERMLSLISQKVLAT